MSEAVLNVRYGRPIWQGALLVFLPAITLPGNFMHAVDQRPVRIDFFSRDSSLTLNGEQAAIYWWLGVGLMLCMGLLGTYLLFRRRFIVMTADSLTMPGFVAHQGRRMLLAEVAGIGIQELKDDCILYISDGGAKPVAIRRSWIEDQGSFERLIEELKSRAPRIAA